MTIKELNDFMYNHGFCNTYNEEDLPKKYVCDLVESALKEGYEKAIDEFAEKLKAIVEKDLANPYLMLQCKQCGIWKAHDIDEIAKQLKEE